MKNRNTKEKQIKIQARKRRVKARQKKYNLDQLSQIRLSKITERIKNQLKTTLK